MAAPGQRLFWSAYDWGLAFLAVTVAGDMTNRYGVASLLWMAIYGLTLARVLLVWRAFYAVLARNWTYLLYPLACSISVIWSLARGWTLMSSVQITMTILIAIFIGWRFSPRRMMLIWLASITLGTVLSLINWQTGALGSPIYSDTGGLLGIYTSKNMLGQYALFASLLAIGIALMPGMARGLRMAAAASWPLLVTAVILSKSMTAVVLLPGFTALTLLMLRRQLPRALVLPGLALAIAAVALVPLGLSLLGIDPVAELFRATGKNATLTGRTEIWDVAMSYIRQSPFLGFGYGAFWLAENFVAARYAVLEAGATAPTFHNMPLEILVGTGLIGLAAMAVLLLTSLGRALRWRLSEPRRVEAGVAMVTILLPVTVSLVEPFLYRQHEIQMIWIVALGTSILYHRRAPELRP